MDDNRPTTTIRLSQEELLFILKRTIIDAPSLPGLGENPLGEIDSATENLLLDAAGRALIARDFVVLDENNIPQIDSGVLSAISICTYPQQMVSLIYQNKEGLIQQHYFYRVPELAVKHTFPYSGLHDFEISAISDMGESIVQTLLNNAIVDSFSTPIYEIDQQILPAPQDVNILGHDQEIQDLLTAKGVARSHAEDLVRTFVAPRLRFTTQIVYQPPPEAKQEVLTLLAADNLWMVRAENPNASLVKVCGLSLEYAHQIFSQIYAQLSCSDSS